MEKLLAGCRASSMPSSRSLRRLRHVAVPISYSLSLKGVSGTDNEGRAVAGFNEGYYLALLQSGALCTAVVSCCHAKLGSFGDRSAGRMVAILPKVALARRCVRALSVRWPGRGAKTCLLSSEPRFDKWGEVVAPEYCTFAQYLKTRRKWVNKCLADHSMVASPSRAKRYG